MVFRDDSGKAIFKPAAGVDEKTTTSSPSREDVTRDIVRSGLSSGYSLRRITSAVTSPNIRRSTEQRIIQEKTTVQPDYTQTRAEYEKTQDITAYDKTEGIQKTFFTPGQEFGEASEQEGKVIQQIENIPFTRLGAPTSIIYFQQRQTIPERMRREREYLFFSQELYMSGLRAHEEWHPETKVVLTGEGYDIRFPYEGAEHYGTYKKQLDKSGFLGLFATAWTPEDPLGMISASEKLLGHHQKSIDAKIQAMHRIKNLETPTDFATWYLQSPATQIGLSIAGGYGIGKIGGYAAGRVSTSILGTRILKYGSLLVGAAVITPTAFDITKTFQEGETGRGIAKIGMTGLLFAGGYSGYKAGMKSTSGLFGKHKGLTSYEIGSWKAFRTSMVKGMNKGEIGLRQGISSIKASKDRISFFKDMRNRGLNPYQPEPEFMRVQALEKTPYLRNWFKRHSISEIFGGAASDKPSTHDIDIMYRSALGKIETTYASTKLGYGDIKTYADIKPWQKPGSIVSRMGTTKLTSYKHPSGLRTGKWIEQYSRLSESSLDLAHKGRLKDIPESIRILEQIYTSTGGVPPELQGTMTSYKKWMNILQSDPIIMKPETSSYYFGKSLGERWYNLRSSFYKKVTPKSYLDKQVSRYAFDPYPTTVKGGGYLPDTPSIIPSVSSIFAGGISSSFFSNISRPNVSTSISKSLDRYTSSIGISNIFSPSITKSSTGYIPPSRSIGYKPSRTPSPIKTTSPVYPIKTGYGISTSSTLIKKNLMNYNRIEKSLMRLPETEPIKRKSTLKKDKRGIGYRYRSWNMPSLEDLFDTKQFKFDF